ncbi:MAG TPA: hypothetical protein DEQ49_06910, partial [Arthrobacter bacterium]|nr:hypothetical protein [Arthrobacter sp.]
MWIYYRQQRQGRRSVNTVPNEGGVLGPAAREASIARLRATSEPGNELDILIVGGGIVGTG